MAKWCQQPSCTTDPKVAELVPGELVSMVRRMDGVSLLKSHTHIHTHTHKHDSLFISNVLGAARLTYTRYSYNLATTFTHHKISLI